MTRPPSLYGSAFDSNSCWVSWFGRVCSFEPGIDGEHKLIVRIDPEPRNVGAVLAVDFTPRLPGFPRRPAACERFAYDQQHNIRLSIGKYFLYCKNESISTQ